MKVDFWKKNICTGINIFLRFSLWPKVHLDIRKITISRLHFNFQTDFLKTNVFALDLHLDFIVYSIVLVKKISLHTENMV